ncbi:hypothetical protein GCM10009784_21150 [Arthrobacter parietis]|uniref:DUF3099 domain-containing protein n=2 Tax=Arthrobacter TaxID=1663 RepID=A0ABT6CQY0_9MICC|nr:DUF3099 domain-containing protein [Arthrobacter vasquezii]MDF9276483.1 DUF3099 domain-containing protein [Arthrobacter vasquezii]
MIKLSLQSKRRPEIHNISDAREAHSDDMRQRMIKYSVSMGIRMVCLILVFVVEGWLQWVMIAGAVFLPYFAVIIANGGSDTSNLAHSDSLLDRAPAAELEAPAPAAVKEEPVTLQGEIIEDEPELDQEAGKQEGTS